ncbi:MAG: glycosyltransferase [Cyclobacteriaceae bacterium]|nr:glycosyltransferase [Cyclobacteriaceae bacterium]
MNKNILIISVAFYPQNNPRAFRTTELAKEFVRQGHKVTVVTPRVSEVHDDFKKQYGCSFKNLGQPKWKAISLKGSGLSLLIRRAIRRFSKLLFEYPAIQWIPMVHKALKNESGYDLLISIAVPHPIHWGVARVWRNNNRIAKTWVADCGDPYMGQENDTFKTPFYFKYVERWWCRKVDFITVPTSGAIQGYYPEFSSKIKVIPQGFRFEDINIKKQPNNSPYPEFAYAGMFIPDRRDPTEFLAYLISLKTDYRFHIYTTTPQWVASFVAKSNKRIILHKPIPRTELLYVLSEMDFLVNFENIGSKQTPSKLIDYAIIDKPILSIKTSNLNEHIVNEFLHGDYTHRINIDREQYRIEKVAEQFVSLLNMGTALSY